MERKTKVEYIHPAPELVEQTQAGVEVWRPVVGGDGWYDVSNLGRVRSWKTPGMRTSVRRDRPVMLSQQRVPKWRYLTVTLRIDGRQRNPLVHRLMADAFICTLPGPLYCWQVAHADDIPDHNTLDNIRWATALAQVEDKRRNGRVVAPERPSELRDGVLYYRCTGCQDWKPATDFGPLSKEVQTKCGLMSKCKECARSSGRDRARTRRARLRVGRVNRRIRPTQEIDGVTHYRCTGCDTWKPEPEFAPLSKTLAPGSRCKIQSKCKPCARERGRESKRASRQRKAT